MNQVPSAMPFRLQIICETPPTGTYQGQPAEFGLQDKRQVLHHGASGEDGSLRFTCEITARPRAEAEAPDFAGPFVHGVAGGRFLYLSWRQQNGAWIKRLKLPLSAITWDHVEAARSAGALEARVSGSGSGTVRLIGAGWAVVAVADD